MRRGSFILALAPLVVLSLGACRDPDRAIEQRVEAQLASEPEGSGITANVDDRVVKLTGVVDSPAERTRLENAVRRVDGVLGVQNQLVVIGQVSTTGANVEASRALAASVDAQLAAAGFDDLDVVAGEGVIRIKGPVELDRHDEALEVARRAAPAFRIDDETVVQ